MIRIAATSDLHFDARGFLTSPSQVQSIAEAMLASGADAIVVAGDIGHPPEQLPSMPGSLCR